MTYKIKRIFMNRFFAITLICASLIACNQKSKFEKANTNLANNILIDSLLTIRLEPSLKDWLDFYSINLKKFAPTDTLSVDWDELKKNTVIYFKKFRPEDEKYMPGVRCYSPDRKRFVDLIESAHDTSNDTAFVSRRWILESPHIEQRIYLYNRIDSTSMLLATKSKINMIENAVWVDNDCFVLAGVDRNEEQSMYYIAIYQIHEKDLRVFGLPDSTINMKDSYLKEVMLYNNK